MLPARVASFGGHQCQIWKRPLAGDWHGFLLRVLAPQRFARRMSKSMGLILRFGAHPIRSPLAREVGSKGYHDRVLREGPYPVE
jgi:hypothetical protein